MARDAATELLSPLPLDTCLRLLGEQIDSTWKLFGDRPLTGRLRGTTMRVSRRIAYRNSFQTHLTATLSAQGDTTRIACSFAMHPFVVAFMAVWFLIVLIVWAAVVPLTLVAFAADPRVMAGKDWIAVVVPTAMLAGGIAMVRIGRHLARNERDEMLALVAATLQATPRA